MPKRKKKSPLPRGILLFLGLAALVFVAGEAWMLLRSDSGRMRLARWMPGADGARASGILARQIRRGLTAAEVPPDSVRELPARPEARAPQRWRVGLRPDQSLFQTNYAITHYVEELGGEVLSGREVVPERGITEARLVVGLPREPMHELVLVRPVRLEEKPAPGSARLALVLYGLDNDPEVARGYFTIGAPFAVAIVAGSHRSAAMFRAARAASREIVAQLPLEPVNYPQVNPGPGTMLVTMRPAEITGLTRRYLDQAWPVVAAANHMGSLATQDMAVMGGVFRELRRRRVPFVQLRPTAGSVCRSLAADAGVLYDEPDAVIDAETRERGPAKLEKRWKQVLESARERGQMMVWLRATPVTRQWLPKAASRKRLEGVDLVPVSALLKRGAAL